MSDKVDTRQRVLNAAYHAFCQRTFAGASIPYIAELAQSGVGSIYRYFPSKEELGNSAYTDAITDLTSMIEKIGRVAHSSIRAEFTQRWQAYADFASRRVAAFHFLSQQNSAFLNEENKELRRRIYEMGTEFIQRGQEADRIRPGEPEQLIALVNGAFFGWASVSFPTRVNDLPQDQRETAEEACWGILKA